MSTQLIEAQEHTLERLISYASQELMNPDSILEALPQPQTEFEIGKLTGHIQEYLTSFYELMIPKVVLDPDFTKEEYLILQNVFLDRFMSILNPSLKKVINENKIPQSNQYQLISQLFQKLNPGYNKFIKKIGKLAHVDYLTGLHTRDAIEEALDSRIQKHNQLLKEGRHNERSTDDHFGGFSLIYLDLNGLGNINDMYGHMAGDIYLKAVAEKIKELFRDIDIISRIGGDEIAALVSISPDKLYDRIINQYEEICAYADNKIKEYVESIGKKYDSYIKLSIGIAAYEDGLSKEDLKERADKALYLSKAISKFSDLKDTDQGKLFFYYHLLNCNPQVFINNAPLLTQIVQIYNSSYNFIDQKAKGANIKGANINNIYSNAKELFPRKK